MLFATSLIGLALAYLLAFIHLSLAYAPGTAVSSLPSEPEMTPTLQTAAEITVGGLDAEGLNIEESWVHRNVDVTKEETEGNAAPGALEGDVDENQEELEVHWN